MRESLSEEEGCHAFLLIIYQSNILLRREIATFHFKEGDFNPFLVKEGVTILSKEQGENPLRREAAILSFLPREVASLPFYG